MTRSYEAVFFDMDGTLVNSEPHWLEAETELMAEFGYQWTTEDQRFCLGGPLPKIGIYMWNLADKKQTPEWFHQQLVERTIEKLRHRIEYMPGALNLFTALKDDGVPVGLVTASPAKLMEGTILSMSPLVFDVAVSGDDVKVTKPDPEGYLLAANLLGVDIRNSIVLEDSLTGIAAAQGSGAFVVAIPHMVKVEPTERQVVIRSLEELSPGRLEEFFVTSRTERAI
jgi:HAD superfamily hydrolase (TIGR01509 family)